MQDDTLPDRLAPVYEQPFRDPLVEMLGVRSWQAAGHGDGLFVDSATVTILSILLAKAEDRHRTTLKATGDPVHRLDRVIDYIHAHLADHLSLIELAAIACQSPFHFARTFKSRMGSSPIRYVQLQRVDRAKQLLSSTDARLIDIAHQCGFADQAHFTTVFRRITGSAPGAWRAATHR